MSAADGVGPHCGSDCVLPTLARRLQWRCLDCGLRVVPPSPVAAATRGVGEQAVGDDAV